MKNNHFDESLFIDFIVDYGDIEIYYQDTWVRFDSLIDILEISSKTEDFEEKEIL